MLVKQNHKKRNNLIQICRVQPGVIDRTDEVVGLGHKQMQSTD